MHQPKRGIDLAADCERRDASRLNSVPQFSFGSPPTGLIQFLPSSYGLIKLGLVANALERLGTWQTAPCRIQLVTPSLCPSTLTHTGFRTIAPCDRINSISEQTYRVVECK